uniref:Secreted protein n=1 Tax=Pararge aegeria TaxID=116150 RepID=S4PSV1_9NEOP
MSLISILLSLTLLINSTNKAKRIAILSSILPAEKDDTTFRTANLVVGLHSRTNCKLECDTTFASSLLPPFSSTYEKCTVI